MVSTQSSVSAAQPPTDGDLVAETDIRGITAEALFAVDQLTEQKTSDDDFFARLLAILVEATGASSGYIWQSSDSKLEPMVKLVSGLEDSRDLATREQQLAQAVFNDRLPALISANENPNAPRQLERCCLLAPLFDQTHCFGVVSLVTYAQNKQLAEAQLELVVAVAARIRKHYLFRFYAESTDQLAKLTQAQEVMAGIGKYIESKPLAIEVVNRLETYFNADRVSLAFKWGDQCPIKAISNQAVFDRRSNVVRGLEHLSARIANIEEPLWYPADDQQLAPSLRRMLDRYLEVSNTLSLALLPLFGETKRRDDPEDIAATIRSDDELRQCVGVLVLEGIERPLDQQKIIRRWSRVESSVSNAVANARQHDALFLMPLWRTLGKGADWFRGHTRRKALLITAAIVASIAALVVVPADFKLRGDGEIQPIQRQHVFAETDGTVDKLYFHDGQQVQAGDLLIDLKNPELAARIAEVEGNLREAEKQFETATVQRVTRAFDTEQEERELVRLAASTEVRVAGLKKQYELLVRTRDQLQIKSPMTGQIVTWDTRQRLTDRPVKRGERLVTVALPTGQWEIELRIPDKRAGYLLTQWKSSKTDGKPMEVSFVLASNPTGVYHGTVAEVAAHTNVDDNGNENVVRVRIMLSPEEFARMDAVKPGTTVIGHIHCGRTSIGYSKLYEFFDWSRRMWFRFVS